MNGLPKHTQKIFETLSKDSFISANSNLTEMRELYECISTNFDVLFDHFMAIGLRLESGNDYYHFTRPETKVEIERKLTIAYKWIDILDFFKTIDPAFGAGTRLSPSALAEQCKVNSELKLKLESMKKITGEDNLPGRIRRLLEILKDDNFVEIENEDLDNWRVLDAIHYIERLIEIINIPEEDETA